MVRQVMRWSERRNDIRAIALVGSRARGTARPDSDLDLVLLCSDPADYLRTLEWVEDFGAVTNTSLEDWGKVQSVRAFYRNGPEVEFGIAGPDWAASPPDAGTVEVLRGGARVLLDRDGTLRGLIESLESEGTQ